MNQQLEFNFDDLSPEEQTVYLKAAQRLLDGRDEADEDEGPCEVCERTPPEHSGWCPLRSDGDQSAA